MSPSRRAVLGLLGIVPVGATLGFRRAPDDLRPGGEYDRFVAALAARDEFSGVVTVAYRGETTLARAHGMANRAKRIPNRVDTIFNLASASKPFTALAIIQLAAAGKVRLDDTLGTYLDGFASDVAGTVAVHHLLTHSSGLGDFQLDPIYQANAETGWTSEAAMMAGIVDAIRRERLAYEPGAGSNYSSSGMAALAAIVAAASGQSYYDYVRRHIFEPAGMSRSDFYHRPQWVSDRRFAHPYWENEDGEAVDGLYERPPRGPSGHAGMTPFVGNGGGGCFSTAGDLVRFHEALRSGRLLDPDYVELLLGLKRPGRSPEAAVQITGMAYGLNTSLYNGQWLAGHGGGMYAGAGANWTLYRDTGWTGVVLSNYRRQADRMATITDKERRLITESRS